LLLLLCWWELAAAAAAAAAAAVDRLLNVAGSRCPDLSKKKGTQKVEWSNRATQALHPRNKLPLAEGLDGWTYSQNSPAA